MRKYITILLAILSINQLSAEVTWSEPKVVSLGDENYRIELTATIDEGWHMYDMVEREGGANATQFTFVDSAQYSLTGDIKSLHPATIKYDDIFEMEIGYYEGSVTFTQDLKLRGDGAVVNFNVEWMLCSDMSCTPPADRDFSVVIGEVENVEQSSKSTSLWLIIIEAMLWGFAALLTPCVFPMVPMTISFFMKEGARGRFVALLYGAFIIALYTLPIAAIILITRVVGGGSVTTDIFNWVATHWLPNILFFIIFMIFAASFFGAFEITLPSSWVNGSDSRAGRGTLGGVFFLALTLVLVSFSCTGPIVGSVLIKSTSGEFWQPIVTMFAFSVAFALPFVAVALFPALIKSMPKSGGWLGSVKIVLGFLELALGLKFLSVADQTYQWVILSREIYLALWIAIFSLLGLYLLGKLRFKHDSKSEGIGVIRLALSIITFAFVIYLIPGMWGAPLKHLAGYLPPPTATIQHSFSAEQSEQVAGVKYAEMMKKSNATGVQTFYDLDEAQEYADRVGKPLLVDFTGHGCVNCREMEQRVWSDKEVNRVLSEEYVVVALYMDDKREVDERYWLTTADGRLLKRLGRINSYIALTRFGVNSQPTYIILGREGKQLSPARGYDLNINSYLEYLEKGLRAYSDTAPTSYSDTEPTKSALGS